uniref:Uncharacterized protein n=1 Tax=Photinus pyralis TaxID=7054 RepID=A0A1Y1M737_PHOPY
MSLQLVAKINRCLWRNVRQSDRATSFRCGRMLMCSTHVPGDDSKIEYRSFQKSSTCQCIRLPLKKSRLANPFPDPLKMIASDTVSDDEKASNMQLTSRLPEYPVRSSVGQSRRRFSSKCGGGHIEKCKKVTTEKCANKAESPECKSNFEVSNL